MKTTLPRLPMSMRTRSSTSRRTSTSSSRRPRAGRRQPRRQRRLTKTMMMRVASLRRARARPLLGAGGGRRRRDSTACTPGDFAELEHVLGRLGLQVYAMCTHSSRWQCWRQRQLVLIGQGYCTNKQVPPLRHISGGCHANRLLFMHGTSYTLLPGKKHLS
ncbi:hypothetical protein N658DRAFT_229149 [Parathielavia hyrcaniae]|uniref:Uncharacterized protein n=1 Tax=Parathielavia hyrcaniae TaxID=113614 RepID=A0AAN6SZ81_9PEZI|nr:hypothetical protein N658DRAFT_229149 [Parathielavia hyrcaniae]